ncbi:MAG: hypothetical protein JJ959_17925 [Nisaea sp.]|uniref:YciI family protein n=1 Tax=Nisaea sp. TaxID=2024842 RepID=UPI001B02CB2B|nr:YciI family protein [Nisaea sp.]MBO6562430.1 hypothetical protein [Nisaea sp.]
MFIILLRFAKNRANAGTFVEGHKAWLKRGFDEGAFLLAGTLGEGQGGAILADAASRQAVESRVAEDPFVVEGVVSAEILDWSPSMSDARLSFLAA